MADDATKRRGRYKEYMRHHNPYKFKPARLAARRRSGRVNLLKADKNPCPTICQSGLNNDQEFDNRLTGLLVECGKKWKIVRKILPNSAGKC